jgi:hypothetical protein
VHYYYYLCMSAIADNARYLWNLILKTFYIWIYTDGEKWRCLTPGCRKMVLRWSLFFSGLVDIVEQWLLLLDKFDAHFYAVHRPFHSFCCKLRCILTYFINRYIQICDKSWTEGVAFTRWNLPWWYKDIKVQVYQYEARPISHISSTVCSMHVNAPLPVCLFSSSYIYLVSESREQNTKSTLRLILNVGSWLYNSETDHFCAIFKEKAGVYWWLMSLIYRETHG